MKSKTLGLALVLLLSVSVFSAEIPAAISKSDCLACHAIDNEVVGPSFLNISKKYRGQRVSTALLRRVKQGGGTWKGRKSTPHQYIRDTQLKDAVTWILTLRTPSVAAAADSAEGPSLAQRAKKIIKGSDCFACHKMDVKLVGPAFKDVRAKYTQKDVPTLVKKVKSGGSGNWGTMPMTPHASLKDEDIKTVVEWILNPDGGVSKTHKSPPAVSVVGEVKKEIKAAAPVAKTRGVDKAAALKVMKGSDCLACHQEKIKVVGPAFVDVAKKYRGDAGALKILVQKVKSGGSGNWGTMPMAPHPTVKDEDLETAVRYILSLH